VGDNQALTNSPSIDLFYKKINLIDFVYMFDSQIVTVKNTIWVQNKHIILGLELTKN
jgi:hypothetical protein